MLGFQVILVADSIVLTATGLWVVFLTIGRSGGFSSYIPLVCWIVVLKVLVAYVSRVYNISLRWKSSIIQGGDKHLFVGFMDDRIG